MDAVERALGNTQFEKSKRAGEQMKVRYNKKMAYAFLIIGGTTGLVIGLFGALPSLVAPIVLVWTGWNMLGRPMYEVDLENRQVVYRSVIGPAKSRKPYAELILHEGRVFFVNAAGKRKKLACYFMHNSQDYGELADRVRGQA